MSTKIYGVKGEDGRKLSRPLLRLAARNYGWGELPQLELSPRGKPLIPGQGRWLSLSHSGGYALCALSPFPVGVDIECIKPHRPGLPAFCFTPAELEGFGELVQAGRYPPLPAPRGAGAAPLSPPKLCRGGVVGLSLLPGCAAPCHRMAGIGGSFPGIYPDLRKP